MRYILLIVFFLVGCDIMQPVERQPAELEIIGGTKIRDYAWVYEKDRLVTVIAKGEIDTLFIYSWQEIYAKYVRYDNVYITEYDTIRGYYQTWEIGAE